MNILSMGMSDSFAEAIAAGGKFDSSRNRYFWRSELLNFDTSKDLQEETLMGFLNELKKLTRPYDDDDDEFEDFKAESLG